MKQGSIQERGEGEKDRVRVYLHSVDPSLG
jgi:hypothetical protein